MTEVLELPTQTTPSTIGGTIRQLLDEPPSCLVEVLREKGHNPEELEEFARESDSAEAQEQLRQLMLCAAASRAPDDARLAAHLQSLIDPRERAWERLAQSHRDDEIVNAMVVESVKGGLVVDLGVRGFVPASHASLGQTANLQALIGRTLPMKIIELNRRRQMVVLSHRKVLEAERSVKRRETFQTMKVGEERDGVVRRLSEIGAFVDIGGIDGLLHVSEIAWKPVDHPSDALKVGQKLRVLVQKIDPESEKVSLSIRRLSPDPWIQSRKRYGLGKTVRGTVRQFNSGGAVIELDEDQEAFIPLRELSSRRINSADEVLHLGEEIEAVIIEMRDRDRRIVLSPRKLVEDRERKEVDSFHRRHQDDGRTTLGDLFGHLFADQLREAAELAETPNGTGRHKDKAAEPAPTAEAEAVVEAIPTGDPGETDSVASTPEVGEVCEAAPEEPAEIQAASVAEDAGCEDPSALPEDAAPPQREMAACSD